MKIKRQFIEVKVTIEVITDEEISYSEAEQLARVNVEAALSQEQNIPRRPFSILK